jgi:ankyrin repeat protein
MHARTHARTHAHARTHTRTQIELRNLAGRTALHCACMNLHPAAIEALVGRGADTRSAPLHLLL